MTNAVLTGNRFIYKVFFKRENSQQKRTKSIHEREGQAMREAKRSSSGVTGFVVCLVCGIFLTAWGGLAYGNGRDASPQSKTVLEITYDNMAKQTVPLDQPSGNIQSMVFRGGQGQGATTGQAPLTPGWDIFNQPLSFGQVNWSVLSGRTTNNLEVVVHLSGAIPNHEFTVGVHLFNPSNPMARTNISGFGGWPVGGEGVVGRDGKSAFVIAYDFGGLKTNASGDGFARFTLSVPPGTYALQYTLRIGAVNTCLTSRGITHGCACVYRTGNKLGEKLETITVGY